MRALWQLTINGLAGRWGRTAALALAVALATALPVGVATAIATMTTSLGQVVGRIAGLADLRVRHRFGQRFDESLLKEVRRWPEVALAAGRVEGGVTLRCTRNGRKLPVLLRGIEPDVEEQVNPQGFSAGRGVRSAGEVALDHRVRRKLDARVGDVLEVVRPEGPVELTVVGICERPALHVLQQPLAVTLLGVAQELAGQKGLLDRIDVRLAGGADAAAVIRSRAAGLPAGVVFEKAEAAEAGLGRRLRWAELLLYVVTVLASLSSGFLILASLTTAVTQRTRELGVLRCIGAGRGLLAASQLAGGLLVALGGAAVGTPLGLLGAYALYAHFQDALPGGFRVDPAGVAAAAAGSVLAGLLGAAYPALLAATSRPLEALAVRARPPRARHVVVCGSAGLVLVAAQPIVMLLPLETETAFWSWAYVGLPLTFAGYFLLSVPLLVGIARTAGGVLAGAFRVPATLLRQAVLASPMRHGFAGGTLMVGMALLVAQWTEGRSLRVGWLDALKMPDAFVHSFWSLRDAQVAAVRGVDGVTAVCPVALVSVRATRLRFGLDKLLPPNTLFVATDVKALIALTDLDWQEGDPRTALRRLAGGRALLVSRDWRVAHGTGVGAKVPLETVEGTVPFEVVGVIASKGLDLATRSFGIERSYADRAISSVFGTRADAERYFKVRTVNLLLLGLRDDVGDEEIVRRLTEAAPGSVAGTSRAIRRRVERSLDRMVAVTAALALGSLLLACLGVANLTVAEVTARRFEFGVLRAVGAQRGLLGRFVAAQTVIVALVGCAAGTGLGMQLALIGRAFSRRLLGLEYAPRLPWDVVAWGALALIAAALLAALPAMRYVMRQQPLALLARRE